MKSKIRYLVVFVIIILGLFCCNRENKITLFKGLYAHGTYTDGDITFIHDGFFGKGTLEYNNKTGKTGFFIFKENETSSTTTGLAGVNDFVIGDDNYWAGIGFKSGILGINKKTKILTKHLLTETVGLYTNKIMGLGYIDGLLYIGYSNYGIGIYNPKTEELRNYKYTYWNKHKEKEMSPSVWEIKKWKDYILIGTMQIGLITFKDGEFYDFHGPWNEEWIENPKDITILNIYAEDEIIVIALSGNSFDDRKGPVYVKYHDDYYKIDNINEYFTSEYGDEIVKTVKLEDNYMMVYNEGIFVYDFAKREIIKYLSYEDLELPDNFISTMDIDDNYVWICTASGINRYSREYFINEYLK